MDLEAMLIDLSDRIPYLQHIYCPEYAPYVATAAAVLIGWLFVSWIFHLIRILLTSLAVSAIAIILISPATSKWCFQRLGANLETTVNDFIHRFQVSRS